VEGIKSLHSFIPLGGNTILANALSCYCAPCSRAEYDICDTRNIRPKSRRLTITVNNHQTGETLRSLRSLCQRGFDLLRGSKKGDLFALYVSSGDRGKAGLGNGQVTANGRFILAELADEKIGSWRGSMLRGRVDVKWFLTDEKEMETAYVFEDKAECDLLGRNRDGNVLVPYCKCGPEGPRPDCRKKHYEELSIHCVLQPGKLVIRQDYTVKENRRGGVGGTQRTFKLTPQGLANIIKGVEQDENEHRHFLNCGV
jgi:hypothetical protein